MRLIKIIFFFFSIFLPALSIVNLKVVPAHQYILQKQDIDQLKSEIEHDINIEIDKLEENWATKQRMRERSAGQWNLHGAPIFLPKQYSPTLSSKYLEKKENDDKNGNDSKIDNDELNEKLQKQLEQANTMVGELTDVEKYVKKGIGEK